MAGNEPVTSPDQHKHVNPTPLRVGGVVTIVLLLMMTIGNHEGDVEDLWLIGLSALIAVMIVVDWVLRRNGLRD